MAPPISRATGITRASIIGSGPNGLAAAIVLAKAGVEVVVHEAAEEPGGGTRCAELTLPGFVHDLGSAVHPMAVASTFFRTLPLREFGLQWMTPATALAHPFDDGTAVTLEQDIDATADQLGGDGAAYRRLAGSLVNHWPNLADDVLRPVLSFPLHPLELALFGLKGMRSASGFAQSAFRQPRARALFAGNAAHSVRPLESPFSAAIALVMIACGHAVGWPIPRGGAKSIAGALVGYLESLGGRVITGSKISSLAFDLGDELPPPSRDHVVLADVSPRQLAQIAGKRLPSSYSKLLGRFQYGPGVFKLDWALSEPIPWKAAGCARAATVHLGGTMDEIAESERLVCGEGRSQQISARPFVLLAQPTLFDSSRAPAGKHIAWAYCHVPNGSTVSMVEAIESQVERFAPGFRDCILARSTMDTAQMESWNANLIGGDLGGGAMTLGQLLFRPTRQLYDTPVAGLYLCSASTPPGGGVHGMCGFHAATRALKFLQR